MSSRAYRIIEIKTEKNPSFNLSGAGEKLQEVLRNAGFYQKLDEGGDIGELQVEELENQLSLYKNLGEDEYARKYLLADIKQAKKEGSDYIQYYCF